MLHAIEFPNTRYKPVSLPAGAKLSEELTIINSPVLFGCRTGICGTCLVQIEKSYEVLARLKRANWRLLRCTLQVMPRHDWPARFT